MILFAVPGLPAGGTIQTETVTGVAEVLQKRNDLSIDFVCAVKYVAVEPVKALPGISLSGLCMLFPRPHGYACFQVIYIANTPC